MDYPSCRLAMINVSNAIAPALTLRYVWTTGIKVIQFPNCDCVTRSVPTTTATVSSPFHAMFCFGLQMRNGNWATLGYFLPVFGAMTSEKSGNPAKMQHLNYYATITQLNTGVAQNMKLIFPDNIFRTWGHFPNSFLKFTFSRQVVTLS